jgi:hypothetical protein
MLRYGYLRRSVVFCECRYSSQNTKISGGGGSGAGHRVLLANRVDNCAVVDRRDKLFYYYTQTENIRHFEKLVVASTLWECFQDG